MSIKSDRWIAYMAQNHAMIKPFAAEQVRTRRVPRDLDDNRPSTEKIISYGVSSYGYDVRAAPEFKIFTNVNSAVIDPKNFDEKAFVHVEADSIIIPPNSFALGRTVEHFKIPRDVLVVCLGKSTYARCFSGDTEVALANGTAVSFKDMARRAKTGEQFFGYGISKKLGLVVTELVAPRRIAREEEMVRVYLDDGKRIDCTPDHLFLTRAGKYVKAEDLEHGQSLMPLYRYRTGAGREFVYDPVEFDRASEKNAQYKLSYWLADAYNRRTGVYTESSGDSRHHVDHDVRNDYPTNIKRLSRSAHASHHAIEHNAEYWTEANKLKASRLIRKALRELKKDPEWRERYSKEQSLRALGYWHQDKFEESRRDRNSKVRAALNTPEWREGQQARLREFYDSEEGRTAMANRVMPIRKPLSRMRVDLALRSTGSVKAAGKFLGVAGITLGRRYPNLITRLRSEGVVYSGDRITVALKDAERALRSAGSIHKAAKLLGISAPTLTREAKPLLKELQEQGVIPKNNHSVDRVVRLKTRQDVYCLTSPETGNFALESGVFVKNCGVVVNVTPLEPEWEGYVTLEFSNTTPLPAKLYANEGCAQMLFFQSDEDDICETSYADRGGKYQGQTGVTLPKG